MSRREEFALFSLHPRLVGLHGPRECTGLQHRGFIFIAPDGTTALEVWDVLCDANGIPMVGSHTDLTATYKRDGNTVWRGSRHDDRRNNRPFARFKSLF